MNEIKTIDGGQKDALLRKANIKKFQVTVSCFFVDDGCQDLKLLEFEKFILGCVDSWMDMDELKSGFMNCSQQSKSYFRLKNHVFGVKFVKI